MNRGNVSALCLAFCSVVSAGLLFVVHGSIRGGAVNTMARASFSGDDKESPFVCNVNAMSASERERHEMLSKKLFASRREVKELPNGYALQLSSDAATVQTAAEWITMERKCCPFFSFDLRLEAEGGPLWLQLTGREGVKPFIRMEFGL